VYIILFNASNKKTKRERKEKKKEQHPNQSIGIFPRANKSLTQPSIQLDVERIS